MTWDPAKVGVVELESGTRALPVSEDNQNEWLCAWCHARVANERDRFSIGGKDEFTFSNPAGFRFDIITFLESRGGRETGQPTVENTWFEGSAWSFCQCAECGQHLGWFYSGPRKFVGLIKERIVRALCISN